MSADVWRDPRRRAIVAVVAVQVLVLVLIVLLHGARIAAGTEVRVPVRPVDPLDLARGAYVELDYGFAALDVPSEAEPNDDVYVVLGAPDANGVRRAERIVASDTALEDGELWLRLPLDDDRLVGTWSISTHYGSADEAQDLETTLADGGGVAVLSLDANGDPTLVDVEG